MSIKGEFDTLDSSVIQNIKYVGNLFKKESNLFVTFNNGTIYDYKNVTFRDFWKLRKANKKTKSVGSLFNALIKSNTSYEYKRVR